MSLIFGCETIRVTIIYHPIGNYNAEFHSDFTELLTNLFSRGSVKHLILGDFNFHMDDATNPDAKKFLDTLSTFDLAQHVHFRPFWTPKKNCFGTCDGFSF